MSERPIVLPNDLPLNEAQEFLYAHGILPNADGYSTRQLAAELARRGWRWEVLPGQAQAHRAFGPFKDHTIVVAGEDSVANLTRVLVNVIQFDAERGLTLFRPYRADLEVRGYGGQVIALVEVKNATGADASTAAEWRTNLVAHGAAGIGSGFLFLVSQDVGFVWDQRRPLAPDAPPSREFSMLPVIDRYAPGLNHGERLGELELRLVVQHWLSDVALYSVKRELPGIEVFADLGFLGLMRDAEVIPDLAA